MVTLATFYTLLMIADSTASMGLERLDPVTRARVLMALLGLVILSVALVACVMIGGRWVRRLARHSPRFAVPRRQSVPATSAKAPISPANAATGDTLLGLERTDETRID
jgi:hypothetical protein